MVAPNAVLLPKVFSTDTVSLGQLLRNPLVPNINTFTKGCSVVKPDDISTAEPETDYKAIVSTDVRGRFDIGLTKFLGMKLHARSTNLLSIEAESLDFLALKNTGDVFQRICEAEEAKKWIGEMVLNNAPCYLVIGLQTLRNAEFKRAVLKEGGAGGYVTVPLEATAQIPLHITGKLSAERFGHSAGSKISGIFGIQVQKLKPRIASSGEPALQSDVSWNWVYQRVKGRQEEEKKQLSIALGDVDVEELVQLLAQDDEDDGGEDEDE